MRANSRSIGFNPSCPSTMKRMRSLSSIARAASVWTSAVNCVSPAPTIPPVSQSWNGWPRISHLAEIRSRVIPGCPCTIAIRRPAMRLNNADFPTFGRPTIAMSIAERSTGVLNASSARTLWGQRATCPLFLVRVGVQSSAPRHQSLLTSRRAPSPFAQRVACACPSACNCRTPSIT